MGVLTKNTRKKTGKTNVGDSTKRQKYKNTVWTTWKMLLEAKKWSRVCRNVQNLSICHNRKKAIKNEENPSPLLVDGFRIHI